MKQPSYEDLRHELDSKMLTASNLPTEQERRDFVTQTFAEIHKRYADKQVNHADYIKLVNRLAAFKQGEYNDHIDTLTGAAQMGMLDIAVAQSKSNAAVLSPEQSRKRRQAVTDLTGVDPIELEGKA